jgi:hypothetical protein
MNMFPLFIMRSWVLGSSALVYRKDVLPEADKPTEISVGQTMMARVRNLDGWLIDHAGK